jgi:hypothetical protein
MDFKQTREMVKIRYELRDLLAQNRRKEARPYLERLRQLAAANDDERGSLEPEIARWEHRLST